MNCFVYTFGILESGFTQYPDDYTREIFEEFISKSHSKSQVLTHRDGNLMYYGYVRKLDKESQYIGFCVLLNDLILTRIGMLFSIFESVVEEMVERGEILCLSDDGNIIAITDNLLKKLFEINRISAIIGDYVSKLDEYMVKLPAMSYAIAKGDCKVFSLEDDENEKIVDATCKYDYTCISKEKDCNTLRLSSYQGVVKKLNEEKLSLSNKYNELSYKYLKLSIKKKTFKIARLVFKICLIVGIVIGCYFLFKYLTNDSMKSLRNAYSQLSEKDDQIRKLNSRIISLENESKAIKKERDQIISNLNKRIEELEDKLSSKQSEQSEELFSSKSQNGVFTNEYEGRIGNIKCRFSLTFERLYDNTYGVEGSYYYYSQGANKKIRLHGTYNINSGNMTISEDLSDGTSNARMYLKEVGDDFEGNFSKDNKSRDIKMTKIKI